MSLVLAPCVTALAAGPSDEERASRALARANNAFALDLLRKLPADRANVVTSPTSLLAALTMTYAGARGETAEQMARALHIDALGPCVHSTFAAYLHHIDTQARKRRDRLEFASALWCQEGEHVLPDFAELLRRDYGSDLQAVDFRDRSRASHRINDWVAEQTRGLIRSLVAPGQIDPRSRLMLVNAIYFKGYWVRPFEIKDTREAPFYGAGGARSAALFMQKAAVFPYWEDARFQLLEMPYADGEIAMDILLPRERDGLAAVERGLTVEDLEACLAGLRRGARREIDVHLPRFKLESSLELSRTLSELGMPLAFGDRADFSGLTPDGKGLSLSALLHKGFIEVDEEGTRAAAATGPRLSITSIPERGPTFRADHPFLFFIRDVRSGSILFLGRVTNPALSPEVRYEAAAQRIP